MSPGGASISLRKGIAIGVLILGWAVYALLWNWPLGRSSLACGVVSFLLLVAFY